MFANGRKCPDSVASIRSIRHRRTFATLPMAALLAQLTFPSSGATAPQDSLPAPAVQRSARKYTTPPIKESLNRGIITNLDQAISTAQQYKLTNISAFRNPAGGNWSVKFASTPNTNRPSYFWTQVEDAQLNLVIQKLGPVSIVDYSRPSEEQPASVSKYSNVAVFGGGVVLTLLMSELLRRYLRRAAESEANITEYFPDYRLESFGGNHAAHGHLLDVVREFTDYVKRRPFSSLPGPISLEGEPNSGRRFAAEVIAGELRIPVIEISPQVILSKNARHLVASAIENTKSLASKHNGAMILLPDVDVWASSRDEAQRAAALRPESMAAIRDLIDYLQHRRPGVSSRENIIFASTVRYGASIDPDLMGCFTERIYIPRLHRKDEWADALPRMLNNILEHLPIDLKPSCTEIAYGDGTVERFSLMARSVSGYQLENALLEALRSAEKRRVEKNENAINITIDDLMAAFGKRLLGPHRPFKLEEDMLDAMKCHELLHLLVIYVLGFRIIHFSSRYHDDSGSRIKFDSQPHFESPTFLKNFAELIYAAAAGKSGERLALRGNVAFDDESTGADDDEISVRDLLIQILARPSISASYIHGAKERDPVKDPMLSSALSVLIPQAYNLVTAAAVEVIEPARFIEFARTIPGCDEGQDMYADELVNFIRNGIYEHLCDKPTDREHTPEEREAAIDAFCEKLRKALHSLNDKIAKLPDDVEQALLKSQAKTHNQLNPA